MSDLCDLYRLSGQLQDSLKLRREQLRRIEAAELTTNRLYFHSLRKSAMLLTDLDELEEAAAHARGSVDGYAGILPREHYDLLAARYSLADIEVRRGHHAQAYELLEFILEDCEALFPPGSFRTVLLTTGRCAKKLGRLDSAEAHLLRALELSKGLAEDHPIPVGIRRDLAAIEEARGGSG